MYSVSDTTGKSLAGVDKDVLLRLNLPRHGLRGQTYDGAANMSGKHAGAQALIKQEQPLALYVHCGAHCTNLITQKACLASESIMHCNQTHVSHKMDNTGQSHHSCFVTVWVSAG